MALSSLSTTLNQTSAGFKLEPNNDESRITHLAFMDSIKIYAELNNKLSDLIYATNHFSENLRMPFGIEKCAQVHIVRGKLNINHQKHIGILLNQYLYST